MSEDVLNRLDALLHKRRSYVAQANNSLPVKAETTQEENLIEEDNDLPILTEVIHLDTNNDNTFANDLSQRLQEELNAALPHILQRVLDEAAKTMQQEMTQLIQNTVQNFLAQHPSFEPALPVLRNRVENHGDEQTS